MLRYSQIKLTLRCSQTELTVTLQLHPYVVSQRSLSIAFLSPLKGLKSFRCTCFLLWIHIFGVISIYLSLSLWALYSLSAAKLGINTLILPASANQPSVIHHLYSFIPISSILHLTYFFFICLLLFVCSVVLCQCAVLGSST